LLNLWLAGILLLGSGWKKGLAAAVAGGCLAAVLFIYVAPALARSSEARLWRGFRVLGVRDSVYGNLVVTETGSIRSIYDNGVILANAPDENAAEEAVHYALLEHPAPRRVLLIGGGANGSIAQALKHPTLERLDYVELDPALLHVFREFFPAQLAASLSDARVRVHYADGRHYLQTTGDKFDVIILNLPDPQTAQLNRFYTAEFFGSARDHLARGGVLALELRSSEDYISPDLAEFLRCIRRTLGEVFPYVAVIPGETIHFFAALQPNVLTDDPQTLIARLESRHLGTQYVREYFVPYRMMPDRMAQIHELLEPSPRTPVNGDFEPIAYYFDVVLWSAQFKSGYARWFRAAAGIGFRQILGGVLLAALLAALIAAYVPTRERRARTAAAGCVVATGFTLMTLQVFVLLAFQAIYGYVYHQLAILIALFMAGMAIGNWLGIRHTRSGKPPLRVMAAVQFLAAISAPALIFLIGLLSRISSGGATLVAAQVVFPALAGLGGMLGGYQFPIATEIYLKETPVKSGDSRSRFLDSAELPVNGQFRSARNDRREVNESPRNDKHEGNGGLLQDEGARAGLGALYGIDLLGGCAGALLGSGYLIPVFGFWRTAWLTAAVNLAAALLAARATLTAKTARA
jgi:spermidine synthase